MAPHHFAKLLFFPAYRQVGLQGVISVDSELFKDYYNEAKMKKNK